MSSIVFVPQCGESSGARGPLAPHLDGFDSWLADQGYAASTRQAKLRLVRAFNGWLEEWQLDLPDAALVDAWFGEPGERPHGAPATGRQLLVWPRAIHCLTPEEAGQKSHVSPAAQIESRYERFLRDDRGLSPVTIKDRLRVVHTFFGDRFPTHALDREGCNTLGIPDGREMRPAWSGWSDPGFRGASLITLASSCHQTGGTFRLVARGPHSAEVFPHAVRWSPTAPAARAAYPPGRGDFG